MNPIRPDATPVLAARGFVSAFHAWKGLLVLLSINGLLAIALVLPLAAALHGTLDPLPGAKALLTNGETAFWDNFIRNRPDVLGPVRSLISEKAPLDQTFPGPLRGGAGSLLALGLLNALAASFFAGGFAAAFASGQPGRGLGSFLSDSVRVAPASFLLSVVSMGGIAAAWWGLYEAPSRWIEPAELAFEWEAIGFSLLRAAAFLGTAGLVRMTVLAARAAIGLSGRANPFLALATGAGRVVARPMKSLSFEIVFGSLTWGPILLWGLFAPVWDGADYRLLSLFVLAQQTLLFFRIAVRVAQLGAVTAWLKRN